MECVLCVCVSFDHPPYRLVIKWRFTEKVQYQMSAFVKVGLYGLCMVSVQAY